MIGYPMQAGACMGDTRCSGTSSPDLSAFGRAPLGLGLAGERQRQRGRVLHLLHRERRADVVEIRDFDDCETT